MPESVARWQMRQVAHFCVTLRHACGPKRRRNRRFSTAIWPKIGGRTAAQGQADRVGLSRQKAEPHRFGAHHPADMVPHSPQALPFVLVLPARFPFAPPIRGHGFPRSHGPAKDIVNHQRVNAWLTPLRAPAVEADEKISANFLREPELPRKLDRRRMRQVAHICVTLRHSCGRKDAEIAAFRHRFGAKSAVESSKSRKSLMAQMVRRSLQMLQK